MIDFWLISTRRILSFSRLTPTTLQLTITITRPLHRVETTLPTTPPIVMVLITITPELHIVNVPPSTQTNILLVYPGATMPDILRYVATISIFVVGFYFMLFIIHLIFCFRLEDAEAYFYSIFTKGN